MHKQLFEINDPMTMGHVGISASNVKKLLLMMKMMKEKKKKIATFTGHMNYTLLRNY
jgi:hypothetical protein